MRTIFGIIQVVKHIEEVFNIISVLGGHVVRAAHAVAISTGSHGGASSKNSVDLFIAELLVVIYFLASERRVGLGVESRESRHGRDKLAHRMGVIAIRLHHAVDLEMVEGVGHNFILENGELARSRQLSVDQEECDFQESGFLSQLLDRIAAILEDALLAIDERDA